MPVSLRKVVRVSPPSAWYPDATQYENAEKAVGGVMYTTPPLLWDLRRVVWEKLGRLDVDLGLREAVDGELVGVLEERRKAPDAGEDEKEVWTPMQATYVLMQRANLWPSVSRGMFGAKEKEEGGRGLHGVRGVEVDMRILSPPPTNAKDGWRGAGWGSGPVKRPGSGRVQETKTNLEPWTWNPAVPLFAPSMPRFPFVDTL